MTEEVSAGEPSSRTLIREADDLYFHIAKELSDARQKIEQGEFDNLKEATRAIRDLRMALQMAMEERAKVAKLDKENAGVVNAYALDFDAARVEIGRRLARLREAGDS